MHSLAGSFLPHETCYLFNPRLIWLHGLSDALIAVSYFTILVEIAYFARRRRDLPFPLIFVAFAVFILGCGSTHLMDVITLWYPYYWLSGAIKALTAIVSVGTAILTIYVIPMGLSLRTPVELEAVNRKLTLEISERRRAESELLESRSTLVRQERVRVATQLASGIAHDLNNMLNVIYLRLNLLARDALVSGRHGKDLQAIDRAVADATRTVARVQELAKPRLGHSEGSVNLHETITSAIELARIAIGGGSALSGGKIVIESRVPESLPSVKGEAAELSQVFLNLMLNAADAAPDGKIEVEATLDGDAVRVRFTDEGAGIPEDKLTSVFEPFFTTKGPRGTGLGLSIAREVMEGLGGSITASNRQPHGAVFTLRLPIAPEATKRAPARSDPAGPPCRFLVIDDDPDNLEALKDLLVSVGHQAEIALSGAKGLEILAHDESFDVVFCDLGMSGMNGWEVAEEVFKRWPQQPFYLVTGWAHEYNSTAALPVPISGLMPKPIGLSEIQCVVAQVRMEKRLAAAN